MEELSVLQWDLLDQLTKAEKNYRKANKERLSKQSYLEARIEAIDKLWQVFMANHRKIVVLATKNIKETDSYYTHDILETFEEQYLALKSTMKEVLRSIIQKKTMPETSEPDPTNPTTKSEVRLPKIQIPCFSGSYSDWQTFYDMFVSLVHNNTSLSEVEKLHYLKSCLKGEAHKVIASLPTTEKNYKEAWAKLKKRFNNKRHNCNAIMNTLFTMKPIKDESASAIKNLVDTTNVCIQSLKNLDVDTSTWDVMLVHLVVSKLDKATHKKWEDQLNDAISEDNPTWTQLDDFLQARFRTLETVQGKPKAESEHTKPSVKKSFHSTVQDGQKSKEPECAKCDGKHLLHQCKQFNEESAQKRQDFVQGKGLCFNCFHPSHSVKKCRIPASCKKCGRKHHSLLHFDRENEGSANNNNNENERDKKEDVKVVANFAKGELSTYDVILATALVRVHAKDGRRCTYRALLDQGSQASFVSEATVQSLGLKRIPISGVVSGLGDGHTRIKHMVTLKVESRVNSKINFEVNAYVLGSLTSILPTAHVPSPDWLVSEELTLADPEFSSPGKIDILLGAEVYSEIMLSGIVKSPHGNLLAQNTVLGWIVSGRMSNQSKNKPVFKSLHVQVREDEILKRFWELEAEPDSITKKFTEAEQACENLYDTTTIRNEKGRYVVKLPFSSSDPQCQYGHSHEIAKQRLTSLERRLSKNPKLYDDYRNVLDEYIELGHMTLVPEADANNAKAVYLPHHAVVREDKETTKVRVVFNASSKGTNGISLNDDLLVGPKIQSDLRHLLMRWRRFPVCIVADLVKMYRQVRVTEDDANFQRILWRPHPDEPIKHYKLLTLTFGTACAPYLAVKTLQRLADDEKVKFPRAAEITQRDYYIDDLMTGCDTETEAVQIYEEMMLLMKAGRFELQKWSSNSEKLLGHIESKNDSANSSTSVSIKSDDMLKVLGLSWNRSMDKFEYTVNLPEPKFPITKRQVLSDIARLYDPIGWIAPVVMTAKLIIQKLWKTGLNWDDEVTGDLLDEWKQFREQLVNVKEILIPRWLKCTKGSKLQLHAFSDASQSGFSAAVYLRVTDEENKVYVSLVTAKTKVAPIEKEVSIPRLELCGAALAAKLIYEVSQVMDIPKENLFAWTDSTVVLAWLKGPAARWVTFVSNRVSDILNIMDYDQWGHVRTENNPADCASRGLKPEELHDHPLWWTGPDWLSEPSFTTKQDVIPETHEEEKIKVMTTIVDRTEDEFPWTKFSSMRKMLRVMSYCRRFLKPKSERVLMTNYIQPAEMKQALEICIKQVQDLEFRDEIQQVKERGFVAKKSVLSNFCPILDQNGILRVGGRITQAEVTYDKKHPIILPAKSHLTKLLISEAHVVTLHGGPQLMLNHLRTKFWILRARERVKGHYKACVTCRRYGRVARPQLMGQIPEVRLKPSKPFRSAGVDYAGPISIRFSPGRGAKSYKGYICLFVCMVTRAIHLEAVTDLTAKGFIAAFRRFTARRGHCQNLYSDNGTNFVGADRMLREMLQGAKDGNTDEIAKHLALEATTWHFIPPHAPNFGGLWEAGVRCVKAHLKRVIGDSTLTYEELATVLSQIEACLNSRPLTVLSDDPNDPLPLTPGHFLVGESLLNVPDEDCYDQKLSSLDRWKLVQKMVCDFWKRWSKEYLVNLNKRYKWNTKQSEPNVGDVVVVIDDNIPPCKWSLGRIVQKHLGPDNLARVVTLKCRDGLLKRPLSKVCVLSK